MQRPQPHGYGCPCSRCTRALALPLSPTVLHSALRRPITITERPSPARQAWDYAVHVTRLWARQQWEASIEPLLWDIYRLRHGDGDLAADVIGSGVILLALGWFAICAWRGLC